MTYAPMSAVMRLAMGECTTCLFTFSFVHFSSDSITNVTAKCSLGLGHTDESVYNLDLGECMDYTARPEKNKDPGPTNFADLESMYGKVDGTSNREDFNRRMESTTYNHDATGADDGEWKLVHRSTRVEKYERDLGDGVREHRSILLA